jgi:hypothetical protein
VVFVSMVLWKSEPSMEGEISKGHPQNKLDEPRICGLLQLMWPSSCTSEVEESGGNHSIDLDRSAGQVIKVVSTEITWSSSSEALMQQRCTVCVMTLIVVRWLPRALAPSLCQCHIIFSLPASEPKRKVCCSFVTMINICSLPSGVVPSDGPSGYGVDLVCIDGREGPNIVLHFILGSFYKSNDCDVIKFIWRISM